MKRLPVIINLILLTSLAVNAQSRDDEVMIDNCTDVYEFKQNKDNVVVKNKITTQYVALRDYDCKIQPSIFYGDNIKHDKASCSKSFTTPEYKSVTPDNVFYDDSKACFYNLTLNRKNKKCETTFERTFTDVHYFTRIHLADEYFIRQKTVKLIIPEDLGNFTLIHKNFKNFSSNIKVEYQQDGKKRIVIYTITNLPAIKSEDNMPSLSSVYPMILIGGAYKDIGELYHWSRNLSNVDTSIPGLAGILDQIGANGLSDLEKIKKTYAWVQSNIRYVAFEAGISSHQPDTPAEVLRKRYGDCKGLALLIKTLLVAQGIDARLTFLGTNSVPVHLSELATLSSMNHVICTAHLNGSTYYLDATCNYIPIDFVPGNIQGMEALVEDGNSYKQIVLPVLPPSASCDSLHINLALSGDNVLTGSAERWASGDMKEAMLTTYHSGEARERSSFAATALNDEARTFKVENAQWISQESSTEWAGIGGSVTDASSVTSLDGELYIELDPDIFFITTPIDTTKRQHDYLFPMPMRQVNEVVFTIPDGYKVEAMPSPFHCDTAVGSMDCSFTQQAGKVVFTKSMTIKRRQLKRSEIDAWNSQLRQWSEACHEQITLKR